MNEVIIGAVHYTRQPKLERIGLSCDLATRRSYPCHSSMKKRKRGNTNREAMNSGCDPHVGGETGLIRWTNPLHWPNTTQTNRQTDRQRHRQVGEQTERLIGTDASTRRKGKIERGTREKLSCKQREKPKYFSSSWMNGVCLLSPSSGQRHTHDWQTYSYTDRETGRRKHTDRHRLTFMCTHR